MGYRSFFLLFSMWVMVYSCKPTGGNKEDTRAPESSLTTWPADDDTDTTTQRKYGVKSGEIVFETILNTISVHMQYKTVVYFDNYGMKECRDTYRGDTLSESYLSDGQNTYRINHERKEVFFSGRAYRGTEPKFGWDEVDQEDKKSGKVKRVADEMIAGKKCMVYTIKSGVVSVKYAGWEGINMLSEIKSSGGVSLTTATDISIGAVPAVKFRIPRGYKVS